MSNYDAYPESVPEVHPWLVPVESTEDGTPNTTYPGDLLQGEDALAVLDRYLAVGQDLNVPNIPEDETFSTDGAALDKYGMGSWEVVRNRLDPAASTSRLQSVGSYATNNMRLAYVDQTGSLMMARCNPANIQALRKAGFREGGVFVPYSNSETAAPGSLAALHLDLFTGLNERDRRTSGERVHPMDLHNPGDIALAQLATRHVVHLESPENADRRVTNDMDPERVEYLNQTIQTLRDQIAFKKLHELMGE